MAPVEVSQWDVLRSKKEDLEFIEKREMTYYELTYNGKSLKFTMEQFGNRPSEGYSLFIALHGGGGRSGHEDYYEVSNNSLWSDMASADLYRPIFKGAGSRRSDSNLCIDGAIYLAPRGVVDAWDTHFQPESYVLIEMMIMKLLQPRDRPLVDSNRIYLTGFSAGGDGSYRLAAHLSDRFAAANASSGHPGEVVFHNFANLPFCSQVGEMDPTINQTRGARALAVVGAHLELDKLENAANKDKAAGLYSHDCFVYRKVPDINGADADHNNWEGAETGNNWYPAYKTENLQAWFDSKGTMTADDGGHRNSSACLWMSQYDMSSQTCRRVRNPIPPFVVWNLASRPLPPTDEETKKAPEGWIRKRSFYWLYLRNSGSMPADYNRIIRASYSSAEKWIQIDEPNEYIVLLLNEAMMSSPLDQQPITVYPGPRNQVKGVPMTLKSSETIKKQTFDEKGDAKLEFSAMVYFEKIKKGEKNGQGEVSDRDTWDVKTADTLEPTPA